MKERPILFSAPMVRAIPDGRKTMTRRVIKPQPVGSFAWTAYEQCAEDAHYKCPYGQPGDRLWVRETWHCPESLKEGVRDGRFPREYIEYRADMPDMIICDGGWTPSIFMPRWASRILLEITAVRVERVQDISEEDAKAEGMSEEYIRKIFPPSECFRRPTAREAFRDLWDSINAKRGYGWDANPWVWVIEFRKVAP